MRGNPEGMIYGEFQAQKEGVEYGLGLMKVVAALEGRILTKQDTMAAGAIGAGMKAFDAAYDKYDIRVAGTKADEIDNALTGGNNTGDVIVDKALIIAKENLNETAQSALIDVANAQRLSIEQRQSETDPERLAFITKEKGGNSALLFALQINPNLSDAKKQCYKELGFLMQLADDFVDETKDREDGIITLVTLSGITKPEIIKKIKDQGAKVNAAFEAEYEMYRTTELKSFVSKTLASAGILI